MSLPQLNRAADSFEFSTEERKLLLRLAHESILSAIEHREISFDSPTAHLSENRGVFTSLYLRSELRGCVGYALPATSVYRAVAETARAAAFDDTRFSPVTVDEASELKIELSILSPPQSTKAEAVEVGRHGLLITMAGHPGLLFPPLCVEQGRGRDTLLHTTSRPTPLP